MFSNDRDRSGTGAGLDMEGQLGARDRIGVQDFVLLEDYMSEKAFVDNLQKRFKENLIYTYIGQVLVSVNPYKNLPIYSNEACKQYRNAHFYEVPPHVFALTDTAYRSLTEEGREQCILISGESGSGKTEASKKVLQFIAAATGHKKNVETVKDKLLQSNPVLEAFGNAKTNRNDNSSRFGKYMDIEFDYTGDPVGGNILNYLLEKSRVVHQYAGERNFHVFYQLLAGADDQLLTKLQLKRNLDTYFYFSHGDKESSDSAVQDKADFNDVKKAMTIMELSESEQDDIFGIVACVLHMGNIGFTEEEGKAKILKPECVEAISKILGCDKAQLTKALTHRTIDAKGDVVTSPLSRELAIYARDALAKAVYDRLFTWLVTRLNTSLSPQTSRKTTVMGILDIYGFEIFKRNSFEQFCINFCNEKLQQLFIQLTLKSEQEEYLKEGIEWEPVKYFNNQIICDLIEQKHRGIIAMLDEECLRPGDASDMTFLEKMNQNIKHPHFISHRMADTKTQKTMGRDEFQLRHYAGDVTYNVQGFLEKNNDLLYRDLREVMSKSTNTITKAVFPESDINLKKRPDTAVTQFKNSLNQLMTILMSKEPSYIRCIKPNETKKAGQFTDDIVTHQVKYLGLMENLRVRRAGFAYRRPYEMFLQRYKSLCPTTWPSYSGKPKDGVQELVSHLNYEKDDYRMGNTKIFIRFPKTLFETEDAFQAKKHDIAAIIQSNWKGRKQRIIYLNMRASAIIMQKMIRGFLAKRAVERRRKAIILIRRFVKGFITRNGPPTELNKKFIGLAKVEWLNRLSKTLPTELMDRSWPYCPVMCGEASMTLQRMHRNHLARRYRRALTPEKKRMFELKVLAEKLFRNKKKSYQKSIGQNFVDDRLQEPQKTLKLAFIANQLKTGESLKYCAAITKFDRHGYKPRERAMLVSNKTLYIVDGKTFKLKHSLSLDSILEYVVTSSSDNLLLLRIPTEMKKDKGDLILEVGNIIELITMIIDIVKKPQLLKIMDADTISHNLIGGKQGVIDITIGGAPAISKGKSGHLIVVTSP